MGPTEGKQSEDGPDPVKTVGVWLEEQSAEGVGVPASTKGVEAGSGVKVGVS